MIDLAAQPERRVRAFVHGLLEVLIPVRLRDRLAQLLGELGVRVLYADVEEAAVLYRFDDHLGPQIRGGAIERVLGTGPLRADELRIVLQPKIAHYLRQHVVRGDDVELGLVVLLRIEVRHPAHHLVRLLAERSHRVRIKVQQRRGLINPRLRFRVQERDARREDRQRNHDGPVLADAVQHRAEIDALFLFRGELRGLSFDGCAGHVQEAREDAYLTLRCRVSKGNSCENPQISATALQ